MDWSEKEILRLIEAYKKRPLLWDFKHRFHYHTKKRNNEWLHLSATVNKSTEECKKKLGNLLALFQHEKVKMETNKDYITSWYAFEALQFLDKNNPKFSKYQKSKQPNEPKDPLNIKVEMEENADIKTNSQSHPANSQSDTFGTEIGMTQMKKDLEVESDSCEEESDRKEEQEIVCRRIDNKEKSCENKKRNKEDRHLESAFSHSNSSMASRTDDDPQIFGNLVAVKLRYYTPSTISLIQNAILQIFVDADRGYYGDYCNIVQPSSYV